MVYANALADIPADVLGAAMETASRESRFFPSAAELREFAGAPKMLKSTEEAPAAWGEIQLCLLSNKWAELPLPTRRALKHIGGSFTVRQADDRSMAGLKARFMDAYDRLAKHDQLAAGEGPGKEGVSKTVAELASGKALR